MEEQPWTVQQSTDLYNIEGWGQGYFDINKKGHIVVRPDRRPGRTIDLFEVIRGLHDRGIETPVLLRFSDLLASRVTALNDAFAAAMEENEYQGAYACVYPIKVNQQRHVVEHLREVGQQHGFGLEAGSKSELLAILGITAEMNSIPIVCNGFKDSKFIEMVVLAAKLGRNIIPIVEKFSELKLIVKYAEQYDVRPTIGVRVKLSSRATGRWFESTGIRSKFGLHISEVIQTLEYLKERNMADCLQLLHCHLGSQVNDIRSIKKAITEMAHVYTGLIELGADMRYIDVGGGLGVDYDGSKSTQDSSMNYQLEEYAADIVYRIAEACGKSDVPHPTIFSESGRALTAYHSILVSNVLDTTRFDAFDIPEEIEDLFTGKNRENYPQPLLDLYECFDLINQERFEEALHDSSQAHEEAMNLFRLGYMTLEQRSLEEKLYWSICSRLLGACRNLEEIPTGFDSLEDQMSDIYFCNMSIFQSMPDSWAIGQIFPVMPIHRLDEQPRRRGIVADITCDSEGKIDRFPGDSEPRHALELHHINPGEPYFIAVFLVGAYQEILGDLHNLFGDTHAVHIGFDESGQWAIESVIPGDTVREVLGYVAFEPNALTESLWREVEAAVRGKNLSVAEGRQFLHFYQHGLDGYTYLEDP